MILLLAVLGCAGHSREVTRPTSREDEPYAAVHRDWTRELKLYSDLETRAIVRATWLGTTTRESWARAMAWRSAWTPEQLEALLAQERAAEVEAHEVVFSAMRVDPKARTFGSAPTDPWQLSLSIDGHPCTPIETHQIKRPDAVMAARFPQLNAWSDLWSTRFARDCGNEGLAVLILAGPQASGQVSWRIGEGDGS